MVSAAPFAEWLRQNVEYEDVPRWAIGQGLDPSTVRRIRGGERVMVHIDTVDRALLGTPTGLWELYPYEEAA